MLHSNNVYVLTLYNILCIRRIQSIKRIEYLCLKITVSTEICFVNWWIKTRKEIHTHLLPHKVSVTFFTIHSEHIFISQFPYNCRFFESTASIKNKKLADRGKQKTVQRKPHVRKKSLAQREVSMRAYIQTYIRTSIRKPKPTISFWRTNNVGFSSLPDGTQIIQLE